MSIGAEIKSALCILELLLSTYVSPLALHGRSVFLHSESGTEFVVDPRGGVLGNSETGNLEFEGPSGLDPARGGLGNSESGICPGVSRNLHTSRNLGIWNLRTRSILESAHEETRNLEIGFPPRTYRGALESWKLGKSESGIWVSLWLRTSV